MKRFFLGLTTITLLYSTCAFAQDGLAKSKNCMACHSVNAKLVGPSFKDVAAKYSGKKGSEEKLVQKVMKGGGGAWGPVAMPANPQVSVSEARSLVGWVLSQK
jgi:cytochrome c